MQKQKLYSCVSSAAKCAKYGISDQSNRELTLLQVLVFYLFIMFLGPFLAWISSITGLLSLDGLVVRSGLYSCLLIPVAYKLDSRIFSKEYWTFPRLAWAGIGVVVVAQLAFESTSHLPPLGLSRILASILVGPMAEECARAVMICPLVKHLGAPTGIIVTALFWAWLHPFFWTALAQQIILSTIFVYTCKSLFSSIAAHTAMNVIAAWHISFRGVFLH